jgi:acyl-CoA dehydrogenase
MALDRDTLAQLLDIVERFVTERLRPLEERVAEEDRIPPEIVAEMRGLGLFGLSIPEEYGGLGLTMSEEAQVAFRLGRTSPAFRSLIGTNNGIGSQGIVMDGTPEQKATWLPRMASGEIVGSFCLTEPEAGSDAGSLKTSARRDGNASYVISGTKRFITNAPSAGLFTVFARTDPRARRQRFPGRGANAGDHARRARQEDGPEGRADLRRDLRGGARAGGSHHRRAGA